MRTILRAFLLIVLILVVGFFALGWWTGGSLRHAIETRPETTPTSTSGTVDTHAARERGAEIGEKAAIATEKAKESLADAAITGKIKAKMALDDHLKSRGIDVTTSGSTVTLDGTVGSASEHDRALRLTRETAGVSQVIDHLRVR